MTWANIAIVAASVISGAASADAASKQSSKIGGEAQLKTSNIGAMPQTSSSSTRAVSGIKGIGGGSGDFSSILEMIAKLKREKEIGRGGGAEG